MNDTPGRRRHNGWRRTAASVPAALCLLVACLGSTSAQMAPRLTGSLAIEQLQAAAQALDASAGGDADGPLRATRAQLAGMAEALRQSLGGNADKPVGTLRASDDTQVRRAHAAAAQVQAYLRESSGCLAGDRAAMARALAASVALLAADREAGKATPVIDSVQTRDQQPVFALVQGSDTVALALLGSNLADDQCPNPQLLATDPQGRPLPDQPRLTGISPGRVELAWDRSGQLAAGSVVLHLRPEHKVFLLGCSAQPEATAALEVVAPARFQVDYRVSADCPVAGTDGNRDMKLAEGALPTLSGYGAAVSQSIDTSACPDPQAYAVSARVTFADGSVHAVGPFRQSAQAAITAGLPGGLSLVWNPPERKLFVRSGQARCKAVR